MSDQLAYFFFFFTTPSTCQPHEHDLMFQRPFTHIRRTKQTHTSPQYNINYYNIIIWYTSYVAAASPTRVFANERLTFTSSPEATTTSVYLVWVSRYENGGFILLHASNVIQPCCFCFSHLYLVLWRWNVQCLDQQLKPTVIEKSSWIHFSRPRAQQKQPISDMQHGGNIILTEQQCCCVVAQE